MSKPSKPLDTDRAMKGRIRGLSVGIIFLSATLGGVLAATGRIATHQGRAVDEVRVGAFLLLASVLLAILLTGGRWVIGNPAMNDELVRANRAKAVWLGYVVLILSAMALYVAMLFNEVDFTQMLPALILIGVVVPAICFVALERKGEKGG